MPVTHCLGYPVTPELVTGLVERAANDFDAWERQVEHAGFCTHPIHLSGRVRQLDRASGEIRTVYTTEDEPDRGLLVACGNRRASVCPACSSTYKGDARHIALTGLVGGHGLPETVRRHPRLFVTFTAPAFGPMHASISQGKNRKPCHPRRGAGVCCHGRAMSCTRLHRPDDPEVGEPLCPDCFDYEGLIVWNALAPELWRRTIQDVRRGIAKAAGISQKAANELVWLNYFKVAEYQGRGAIHFHALLRLDDVMGRYEPDQAGLPPKPFDATLLEGVVKGAVAAARAPDPRGGVIGWGAQLDVRRLDGTAHEGELSEEAVCFYVAKYAAKGSESLGASLNYRIRSVEALAHLAGLRPHIDRAVKTAWALADRTELDGLNLGHWAHCLGFGGHFATKSRNYSTTFKARRRIRREYRRRQQAKDELPLDAWGRPEDDDLVVVLAEWSYRGSGFNTAEKILAMSARARALEGREALREERAGERQTA